MDALWCGATREPSRAWRLTRIVTANRARARVARRRVIASRRLMTVEIPASHSPPTDGLRAVLFITTAVIDVGVGGRLWPF